MAMIMFEFFSVGLNGSRKVYKDTGFSKFVDGIFKPEHQVVIRNEIDACAATVQPGIGEAVVLLIPGVFYISCISIRIQVNRKWNRCKLFQRNKTGMHRTL